MALTAEEKEQIAQALAYGEWSEAVMNAPAWGHVFGVMRNMFTDHVIRASTKKEVYAAKARLEAVVILKTTLEGAIAAAKAAQEKRKRERAAKNAKPDLLHQRIE